MDHRSVCSKQEAGDRVHELSLCEAIMQKALAHADGHRVEAVTVRIGHLRQVVPDALQFSWQVVTDSSELKGAELVIEQVPAVVECTDCGQRTTLDMPILACSSCESFEVKLVSGDEFLVVSMDLGEG
jgi:hydrogenase nickel incorporation protein HypA/HybF